MTKEKQITEINLPSGRYLVVKVPKDTVSAKVYDKESLPLALMVFIKDEMFTPGKPEPIWPLPEGNWQIIGTGTSDKITEQEWKGIVEWYEDSNDSSYDPQYNETTYFDVFKDYITGDIGEVDTATESGHSLILSRGFELETTVILKDIK